MRRSATVLLALLLLVLVASAASAAVSTTRAELSSGQLRVEGSGAAANATVTVTSPESTASGPADGSGTFRIEASNYRSSTCSVTVTDGSTSVTASLSGCTTSPPPPPPPSSGTCTIDPQPAADGKVGTLNTWFYTTTGCRTSQKPVRFSLVSGRIPPGTRLFDQGVSSGGITGTPTTQGLFTFTLGVRDFTGATDTESFSIRIAA